MPLRSVEEVAAIVAELGTQDAALVVVGVETGLRPGEFVALEGDVDVDRKDGVLVVERVYSAGKRPALSEDEMMDDGGCRCGCGAGRWRICHTGSTHRSSPHSKGDGTRLAQLASSKWEPAATGRRALQLCYLRRGDGAGQGAVDRRRCKPCGTETATGSVHDAPHVRQRRAGGRAVRVRALPRPWGRACNPRFHDAQLVKGSEQKRSESGSISTLRQMRRETRMD